MYRRKDGGNYYITVGGVRKSAGTKDRARAKRREQKENTQLWDTRYGLAVPSWEKAALSWSKEYPKEAGRYENLKFAKWWLPKLKGRRITDFTREFIHGFIVKHRPGVDLETRVKANSTANSYVGFVRRVCRHSNLNPRFIRYPAIRHNERWLPPEEWWTIRPLFTQDELDIFEFIMASGVRESNAMRFERQWDKGTFGLIPSARTKTDAPYGLPWSKTALAVLARRRKAPIQHPRLVFTENGKPWYALKLIRALERACGASEIEKVTPHGLRHTFASWLAHAGVAREIRERLMGHVGQETQDTYTHFNVETLRPYIERLDVSLSTKPSHPKRKKA